MARLFVFGIGGTGARVLKSLALLMAAGVDTNGYEIIPIIIDPHKDLPELIAVKKLLTLYASVHKGVYRNTPALDHAFYRAPMMSLGEISNNAVSAGFDFDERIDEPFGDFISYDTLPVNDINKNLIDLLYSETNLKTPLSVGFKGNPNIGSVVLNKFDDSFWYRAFENIFSQDDRIFIISSIFGGTGAAGFPLLLKNMRNSKNMFVRNAMIAALPVMPYFKLTDPETENGKSDIDSNTFFTKTKSALSYYERNLKEIDMLYYLADPHEQSQPYRNDEKQQNNKAHLIELLGANAVINFCKKRGPKPPGTEFYQYSLQEESRHITLRNIGDELRNLIASPIVDYYVFTKVHEKFKQETDAPFIRNEGFDQTFFRSDMIRDIEEINKNYFTPWLAEMDSNERKFGPLNLINGHDNFHKMVVGYEVAEKGGMLNMKKVVFNSSNYINRMETARIKLTKIPNTDKITKYLLLASSAIHSVNEEQFKIYN